MIGQESCWNLWRCTDSWSIFGLMSTLKFEIIFISIPSFYFASIFFKPLIYVFLGALVATDYVKLLWSSLMYIYCPSSHRLCEMYISYIAMCFYFQDLLQFLFVLSSLVQPNCKCNLILGKLYRLFFIFPTCHAFFELFFKVSVTGIWQWSCWFL